MNGTLAPPAAHAVLHEWLAADDHVAATRAGAKTELVIQLIDEIVRTESADRFSECHVYQSP